MSTHNRLTFDAKACMMRLDDPSWRLRIRDSLRGLGTKTCEREFLKPDTRPLVNVYRKIFSGSLPPILPSAGAWVARIPMKHTSIISTVYVVFAIVGLAAATWGQVQTILPFSIAALLTQVTQAPPSPAGQQPTTVPPQASVQSPQEIRIGIGDLLNVNIYGYPDFNHDVRVPVNGEITLPLIGAVRLIGFSAREAEVAIRQRLINGGFFINPQVSVFVKEYATQGVSVLGEVNKPGVYPLLGPRRLFDVISAAGGLSPKAGKRVTLTHRSQPGQPVTVELSTDPTKSITSNIEVLAGDTVVVAQAGIVYVLGDVGKPSGFTMDATEDISALQALALAGGANHTAALKNTRLIRKNKDGQAQEVPIALDRIMQAKLADIHLQPGDVIFIPTSTAKSVLRRSAEAILQAATGVAIYSSARP
jgi:polysaccharide biosynthesis/export protein